MCGNDQTPTTQQPKVMTAEERAAQHGRGSSQTSEGSDPAAAGGQEATVQPGSAQLDKAKRYIRDFQKPFAELGIFATRQIDGTGTGKLKSGLSSANPFYATMAATAEAQAKSPRVATSTQSTGTQSIKTTGAGSSVTRNYRIGG